jgi:2-hydroxycyclohexanecarboxyl-CoA dehydrogenase
MSFEISLQGKRALVTGAGQGVGEAIVASLAQAGASVAVNDLRAERSEEVAARLRDAGHDAQSLPFDVTDWLAVQEAINAVEPFDVLVNNAGNAGSQGWTELRPFAETEPGQWQRFIAVNLMGVMHCARAVLQPMIDRRYGRIVTIISEAARYGDPHTGPYAAAKAGAAGFSRVLAREVGRFGITVNNISLATVMTPATAESLAARSEPQIKESLKSYVIRRHGEPRDVTPLVTLLVSDHSAWTTGQTFAVNGGYTMSL